MLLLSSVVFSLKAQVFFDEGFSSVPPTGWSIDANWSASGSANAGGTSPEARFSWDPNFTGESRLISPATNLTSLTQVSFSFKQMLDHYDGDYTIGVATRSGGGDWNIVWELVNPGANAGPEEVELSITNSDVGQPDFEICFYFSGDSYNLNYWYIDDAKLYAPFDHDVATKKILGDIYFDQGDDYITNALIKNAGLNEEAFDLVLEIIDATTDSLLHTETINTTLAAGIETTLAFGSYVLPYANFMYEVIVYTMLSGDMNPGNDTANKFIYTYTSERGMVVLEIGTGTWSQFCPGAAIGADELIENGHNVALIENHNGDDYANTYSDARNSYYSISGYPTAVFDGLEKVVDGSISQSMYPTYLPFIETREAIKSAFSLMLYGKNTAVNDYEVRGAIHRMGPGMAENIVLHIVLTESHIIEYWQGLGHLNFVTRLMMPDENGTVVDVINNDYIEVNETFQLNEGWDVNECELVYFLQDTDTKEILQAGKVMVNDLIPYGIEDMQENSLAIHNIYPNPFSNETNINFSLANTGNVQISIYDLSGRVIANLANEDMAAGEHKLVWEAGNDVPDGIYFCTISSADHKLTQKVILAR